MKKIAFVSFLLLSSFCKASNLEFNQVILIDVGVNYSKTVPSGKVWELKAILADACYIAINGKYSSTPSFTGSSNLPFWLPAGTVISGNACGGNMISVIEYNIVP